MAVVVLVTSLVAGGVASAGHYFSCDDMDYFSTERSCQERAATARQRQRQQNENTTDSGFTQEQVEQWAEPSVDSSGKVTSKLPPLPVMRMLVDPTEENAQKYQEWHAKRMQAIERAQALVQPKSGGGQQPQGIDDVKKVKSVEFYFSPT